MSKPVRIYNVTIEDSELFSIEALDERPTGFSVCVPELAIYTFGKTEKQGIERALSHVCEKYQQLLLNPIPLNENEQEYLQLYQWKIIPALVEAFLKGKHQTKGWRWLRNLMKGVTIGAQIPKKV